MFCPSLARLAYTLLQILFGTERPALLPLLRPRLIACPKQKRRMRSRKLPVIVKISCRFPAGSFA
jgi:hypothetical protein